MDENTHVYCVDCKWFRLCDEEKPYCLYEGECDIWNCEDSKPFKDRPRYEEEYNPCKTCGTQRCFPEYCKIAIRPKVENGKVLLDKNNKDHRYIMEEK